MPKIKIGISFVLGIVLFLSAGAYFTASSFTYGAEYQQLMQIKHLIWIAIVVYIAGQMK
jgi:ABC-type Na+ efflux pump permease subunit